MRRAAGSRPGREGDTVKDLKPYREPPPKPKKACAACKAFAPECLVPVGEEAVPMCWLCAHHVVDHETPVHAAPEARCECLPHQIYPGRAVQSILTFDELAEAASSKTPREREREKLLSSSPEKLAAWAREAHKQMSDAQIAAVKKRLPS